MCWHNKFGKYFKLAVSPNLKCVTLKNASIYLKYLIPFATTTNSEKIFKFIGTKYWVGRWVGRIFSLLFTDKNQRNFGTIYQAQIPSNKFKTFWSICNNKKWLLRRKHFYYNMLRIFRCQIALSACCVKKDLTKWCSLKTEIKCPPSKRTS